MIYNIICIYDDNFAFENHDLHKRLQFPDKIINKPYINCFIFKVPQTF